METSILKTIRKMIGGGDLGDESGPFDEDLIVHINTYLQVLSQLGVGKEDFQITGLTETWDDFYDGDSVIQSMAKTYLYSRVKAAFDPPQSQSLLQSLKEVGDEMEWRLNAKVDRARAAHGG